MKTINWFRQTCIIVAMLGLGTFCPSLFHYFFPDPNPQPIEKVIHDPPDTAQIESLQVQLARAESERKNLDREVKQYRERWGQYDKYAAGLETEARTYREQWDQRWRDGYVAGQKALQPVRRFGRQ